MRLITQGLLIGPNTAGKKLWINEEISIVHFGTQIATLAFVKRSSAVIVSGVCFNCHQPSKLVGINLNPSWINDKFHYLHGPQSRILQLRNQRMNRALHLRRIIILGSESGGKSHSGSLDFGD